MKLIQFVVAIVAISGLSACMTTGSNNVTKGGSDVEVGVNVYQFELGKEFFKPEPLIRPDLVQQIQVRVSDKNKLSGEGNGAYILLQFKQPLTRELKQSFSKKGVIIHERINAYTWVAQSSSTAAKSLLDEPSVRWADVYPVAAKISPHINRQNPFEWQKRDNNKLAFSTLFHKGVTASEVQKLLKNKSSFTVEGFDSKAFPIVRSFVVSLTIDELDALAAVDIVKWIEPVQPPYEDMNFNNAQPLSNVNIVQVAPYNLNGNGITVGVWEVGDVIDTTPLDLAGRVVVQTGQTAGSDDHAVHVAGTIGSSGTNVPAAEGMAPNVTIASWDANNDTVEMTNAANSTGGAGQPTPIQASNHSYGFGAGWNGNATVFTADQNLFGQYNNSALNYDNIVAQTGLIVFKAAGNERNDVPFPAVFGQPGDCLQGGFAVAADCITSPGTAKNVITMGAMNGAGAISGFSSFGPTDDGRIKPDLVAQGSGMTSLACNCFDDRDGNGTDDVPNSTTATRVMGGTSMSTPVATGVAALLLQEANNQGITITPEGMKALMIQTAQDVNGPGQSTLGPDFATGWGIIDAQAAADLLRLPAGAGLAQEAISATGAANAYTHSFFVPAGQAEIHVTLAWTDPGGNPATPSAVQLVNDLDLRLIAPDDTVISPWLLNPAAPGNAAVRNGGDDTVNNVEQVSVLAPMAGVWTVRVTAKAGSLVAGLQNFAIAGPLTPLGGPIVSTKADIMMVMDRSGSMILPSSTPGLNKLQALQSAATEFVDFIEIVGGHQLGLIRFDTTASSFSPAFDLQALNGTSVPNARTAIGSLTIGNMTNVIDGVTQAQSQLSSPSAANPKKIVFLFSDGRHNRPVGSNVSDINGIMADETDFYAIGFGTDVDSSVMPGVAVDHNGLYFEEQTLSAGQLSKLFLTVAGLAVNEDIVIDPDYALAANGSATQKVVLTTADRFVTFATHWDTPNEDQMHVRLYGPKSKCRIPLKDHVGLATRSGKHYRLIRVQLPYSCTSSSEVMHEGEWRLTVRNKGENADTAKVMVLAESALKLVTDVNVKDGMAMITAKVLHKDKPMRDRVYINVALTKPIKSTGDSEAQDKKGAKQTPNTHFNDKGSLVSNPKLAAMLKHTSKLLKFEPRVMTELPQAKLVNLPYLRERVFELIEPISYLELKDDGSNGDKKAGDGVFSARVKLAKQGLYQMRIISSIKTPSSIVYRENINSGYNP